MSDTEDVIKDYDYWMQKNIEYREQLIQDSKANDSIYSIFAGSIDINVKDLPDIFKGK